MASRIMSLLLAHRDKYYPRGGTMSVEPSKHPHPADQEEGDEKEKGSPSKPQTPPAPHDPSKPQQVPGGGQSGQSGGSYPPGRF